MAEGVVFDLGYSPHEGERLGRRAAMRALFRDGLRRVLGLRRKARKKVFPWVLMAIAVIPAAFLVGLQVLLGEFIDSDLASHANYFGVTTVVSAIFVALAASELLVPDRVNGVMNIYASRPLTSVDYLAMRAAAVGAIVFGFIYLPQFLLFFGNAWVSPRGFGAATLGNLDLLWETALASLAYVVGYGSIALLISAFSKRTTVAAALTVATLIASGGVTFALVESGFDIFALLSFNQHPSVVKDWLLGADTQEFIAEQAGFGPLWSVGAIVVSAVVVALVLRRRYRKTA